VTDGPVGYEEQLVLADGRRVSVRPIWPTDAEALGEAIRHGDPQTVRSRFLGAAPPVTPALLRRLTEIDYVRRFALVGFAEDGTGVAIARYIATDDLPTEAEIAIVVHPEWRRVGLATQLIQRLGRRAVECGITSFTALYWSQNRPVAELAHDGHARVSIADGVAELRARLVEGS
jgi:GNAT superfamily N-acetyltransferase